MFLAESKCLLMAIQKRIGEGINPTIKTSPEGDILQESLELLWNKVELGLFTLFVKITSHRGEDECKLCKFLYPEQTTFLKCLGHIQGYCTALQKPRIAVHHGIWRDLIMHIGRQSLEENEDRSQVRTFLTSVSAVKHENER